ncbi:MAG: type I glyceraldehyde-3-phosphate dehydrogenase [Planctomycetes bacterium]|nr:type I glyceraldehyde-3-phosphate dehydrogenase [Planctomycetota bacterium]MCB9918060.1 type I glyceraldehyde-3-phosphate dehydrogenase [Planctomycetota bacterium]
MVMKIGINGFGRIGRMVFRIMEGRSDMEVVAINDLAPAASLGHLLKYDTVHGRFPHAVQATEGKLTVGHRDVAILSEKDPANLPWSKFGVDFVVESTGFFTTQEACMKHVSAGAPKVCLTVPPKGEIDRMVVLGVNDDDLKASDKVISNASCTTNCLAPAAKVLHEKFGIVNGLVTTVHAYTNDQRIADMIHSDLRRARAGAQNIIPTTTGAARAVGKVLPALAGKLDGMAMRVPVPDGSVVDLVATLSKKVTKDEINKAFEDAASGPMRGILAYTEDPIVSSDIIGNPHSSIVDGLSTMVIDNVVKIVTWYDNEWGYSNRVCDLVAKAHHLGR